MQYDAFELRPLAQPVEYFGQANVIPLAACGRKRPSVAAQHFIKRVEGARTVFRIFGLASGKWRALSVREEVPEEVPDARPEEALHPRVPRRGRAARADEWALPTLRWLPISGSGCRRCGT